LNKQERAELIYQQKHKIINGIEHKLCRQCNEFLPMTKEYYLRTTQCKDGFMAICKKCYRDKSSRIPISKGLNDFIIDGDVTTLLIDNGFGEVYKCSIDTEELQKLKDFDHSWYGRIFYNCTTPYIITGIRKEENKTKYSTLLLHRFIMNVSDPEIDVDHIDHDTLNNKKENLRVTEAIHNTKNRKGKNKNNQSGYRNVFWDSNREKWKVSLCKNYKHISGGYYDDVHEAGSVAEEMREKYYGEFKGES